MEVLYFLEKIRMPVLNEFMLGITYFVDEIAFLVAAMIIFWCVDKRQGYYILGVGFVGTLTNQFLKLWFRIPRPWVLDENFTILEQAREAATGYSFPSGHTQSAVGTFGSIAAFTERKWLRFTCIVLAVLVGFSRTYIGVHFLSDVLVGAGMACLLIAILKKPVLEGSHNQMKAVIAVMLAVAVAFLLYVSLWNFPEDMDIHNLESGYKNAYTMLGCLAGVAVVYVLDWKWLNFSCQAVWWVQIIKVVVGLLLVLAVKEGLRAPLELLLPVYPARAVRYFLIVITAGTLWPMTFKHLSKLGVKK